MNYSFFIKDSEVLVMSPKWNDHNDVSEYFESIKGKFELSSINDTLIISKMVAMVLNKENNSVDFGSKWNSTKIDISKIYVLNKKKLINIKNFDQLTKLMGNDRFLLEFY